MGRMLARTGSKTPVVKMRLDEEQWECLERQLERKLERANQLCGANGSRDINSGERRYQVFGVWFNLWAEQSAVYLDKLPADLADLQLLLQCRGSDWDSAVAACRRVVFVLLRSGVTPKELELPPDFKV